MIYLNKKFAMKKFWICVLAVIMIVVASCYEINEEITITDKGTGTYATKMDMSALLQMVQSMASEEEIAKSGLSRTIDTTISMKSIIDTAKDVTEEQRRLFKDGTMKLKINMQENIFTADINFPFKSFNDLQSLMSGSGTGGLADIFKQVLAKPDSTQPSAAVTDQAGLEQISNVYDVSITKNSIVRKLNKAKFDSLMAKPEVAQAKQMVGGFEILYTTTIRLPRPVKKFDNEMIKLSADKKTVTMKYDLVKLFESPEKFSYSIEY
jgi:hypothetical protein